MYDSSITFYHLCRPMNIEMDFIPHIIASDNNLSIRLGIHCATTLINSVYCSFSFINEAVDKDYYIMKSYTPVEGILSDFLHVTRDGQHVPYDGIFIHRIQSVDEEEYFKLPKRQRLSVSVDISSAFNFNKPGHYKVSYDGAIIFKHGNAERVTVVSEPATLQISGTQMHPTVGELSRQLVIKKEGPVNLKNQAKGSLLQPIHKGQSSPYQQKLTNQVHKAMYYYLDPAIHAVDKDFHHYQLFFGRQSKERVQIVKDVFQSIKKTLTTDTFTYYYNGTHCVLKNVLGYTMLGARTIVLCPLQYKFPAILSLNSQLNTLLHEMTHAVVHTIDIAYGKNAMNLASYFPDKAIVNAANYGLYFTTINPIDYGIDSIEVYQGHTFITAGPVYLNYSDTNASVPLCNYPKLIMDNWGNISHQFNDGFDSMIAKGNELFITRGSAYIKITSLLDRNPQTGSIADIWGNLPSPFNSGFDSGSYLPDGQLYITRGLHYIRYSNWPAETIIDKGYPKLMARNYFGISITNGIDAVAMLYDKKICMFSREVFSCFNVTATQVEHSNINSQFDIIGNFGTIEICLHI